MKATECVPERFSKFMLGSLMLAAALVVALDHRAALQDLGIPMTRVWRRWIVYSRTAETRIVEQGGRSAPVYAC